MTDNQAFLDEFIQDVKKMGASAADAVLSESASVSLTRRLGKLEKLEQSETMTVGLRVFDGSRAVTVSSTDTSKQALQALAEKALVMVKEVPEDPYTALASEESLVKEIKDLDLHDATPPDLDDLADLAGEAEAAALAFPEVKNSEGAEASWSSSRFYLSASNGFSGNYARTGNSLSVCVLAGEGTAQERDYDFASCIYREDLPNPQTIGENAAQKAIIRLNPRRIETGKMPVVFSPRVAKSLLGAFLGAVNGFHVARGTSFLKDQMGKEIFSKDICIMDHPHRLRGLRSRPFDAEGGAAEKRLLVENGILNTWILDGRSALQLGLKTTGHASRGLQPSPSNVSILAGKEDAYDMLQSVKKGLYVTELMGFGVNPVTGDYSQGAAGLIIEKGVLGYAVSEVTIAGNLKDMFKNMVVADDLEFKYGIDSPTVLIDGMTVAGI
ncbi:MAG: TldD/PmbA family protein [Alphaproteobacteria bacterium]